MAKYDVGILGAGGIAKAAHLPAYSNNPKTEVTCIAEIDDDRRRDVATEYSVSQTYADAETLVKEADVDIVSICTPPNTHESLFVNAAEREIHIFCEKPMAIDLEAALAMKEAAQRNNIVTQIGYVKRYTNNYKKVHSFHKNGILGSIKKGTFYCLVYPPSANWRYDPKISGGGIITENLPHWLDYYMSLLGDSPSVEQAKIEAINGSTVEDFADITLSFGETTLNIIAKWIEPGFVYKALRKNILVGEHGEIEFDLEYLRGNVRGKGFQFKYGEPPSISLGALYQGWFGASEQAETKPIMDFINRLDASEETTAPVEWGVKVTRLREAIYEVGGI